MGTCSDIKLDYSSPTASGTRPLKRGKASNRAKDEIQSAGPETRKTASRKSRVLRVGTLLPQLPLAHCTDDFPTIDTDLSWRLLQPRAADALKASTWAASMRSTCADSADHHAMRQVQAAAPAM